MKTNSDCPLDLNGFLTRDFIRHVSIMVANNPESEMFVEGLHGLRLNNGESSVTVRVYDKELDNLRKMELELDSNGFSEDKNAADKRNCYSAYAFGGRMYVLLDNVRIRFERTREEYKDARKAIHDNKHLKEMLLTLLKEGKYDPSEIKDLVLEAFPGRGKEEE